MKDPDNLEAYKILKRYKYQLTRQQVNTLKGQIKAGDLKGFYKGLKKILNKEDI